MHGDASRQDAGAIELQKFCSYHGRAIEKPGF
jgi:hypothetical protein